MNVAELNAIAHKIVDNGRGILAADESTPTIGKRFATINVNSTEELRRSYRQLLFTTEGVGKFIGGVILYDETIRQKTDDGTPFTQLMDGYDCVPGIKVDMGAKPLVGHDDETITEGLDGLRDRLKEYYELGARFAKWRAVINIAKDVPSAYAIKANADALARYAVLCQEAGIVPIVEPEVLMDGDHDIDRCDEVTTEVLKTVFAELHRAGVALEGILLKPNMVIAGKKCATQATPEQVAARTLDCLKRCVPAAVPGIVFLSGGQSELLATQHLNLMNKMDRNLPWALSYSYGRALQESTLKAWGGSADNVPNAQKVYFSRAQCNTAACNGEYNADMEVA